MTPATIVFDILRKIPPWLRATLLGVFAVLFIINELLRIFEVDWYDFGKVDRALLYVGGYLSIQSVANVKPKVEGMVEDAAA